MGKINLTKNGGINLSKEFTEVAFNLYWGSEADVDIHAFLLKKHVIKNEKDEEIEVCRIVRDEDFVFYRNRCDLSGSVIHMGDVRSGNAPNGGNETININLRKIPSNYDRILFTASIATPGDHFGNIGKVSCVLTDETNGGKKLKEYLLSDIEELYGERVVELCTLDRQPDSSWDFSKVGISTTPSLLDLVQKYGGIVEKDEDGTVIN